VRALVVLGEGGHTKEMLTLVDMLGEQDFEYGYVLVEDDVVSEAKIRHQGPVFRLPRPRGKEHHFLRDVCRTLYAAWRAWHILRRFRPQVILSSGPAVAVPVCFLGRFLGAKVIFVETGSRVTRLSLTGRLMYRVAHLFFVQWPELQERYPRAIYAGRLF